MKLALFCLAVLSSAWLYSQEDCFDGIDNDNDGLIDLNDPDGCDCSSTEGTELVLNGDFEDFDVCPNGFSQLPAASGYYISQGGSTDYYNSCDYMGSGLYPNVNPLLGGANGNGIVGFFSDPPDVGNYREYVSTCLSNSLEPGQTYTLSFQIATTGTYSSGDVGAIEFLNCTALSFGLFGSTTCPNDIGSDYNGCISNNSTDYINLLDEEIEVLVNEWSTYTFSFTVPESISNIVIGGGCGVPVCNGPGSNSYFYLDNLSIQSNPSEIETPEFTVVGNSCQGFSFAVSNPPFDTYQWFVNGIAITGENQETFDIPADSTPTVSLGVTGQNNQNITFCNFSLPVSLSPEPEIELDVNAPDFLCAGETAVIDLDIIPAGDYSVLWNTNETSESIEAGIGDYQVSVTNNETNCTNSLAFTIEDCEDATIQLELITNDICLGQEASIEANVSGGSPPYTFSWSPSLGNDPGPFSFPLNTTSEFSLIVSDSQGNTAEASTTISVIDPANFSFTLGPDTAICRDEFINLSPQPLLENGSYLWNNGESETEIAINQPGTYTLTLQSACGSFEDEIEIGSRNDPVFPPIPSQLLVCEEGSRTLSIPQNAGFVAYWENGALATERTFTESGPYSITFISECRMETENFSVRKVDCECEIYVPNAFSPNGDGVNDVFGVSIDCDPESYSLRIFNRWGIEVFNTVDPDQTWLGDNQDGNYFNGPTIYNYLLEVQPKSPISISKPITLRGSITVVR